MICLYLKLILKYEYCFKTNVIITKSNYFQIWQLPRIYNKSNPVVRMSQEKRTYVYILSQLINANWQWSAGIGCWRMLFVLVLIRKPHSSKLLMKFSVSTWADLFSFLPNGRLLLTYGMWRRLLNSSRNDWFLDGLPFLSFSNLSCNPRSRSVRFHFSPWKCSGFKRW
jgi:hypothetical protein